MLKSSFVGLVMPRFEGSSDELEKASPLCIYIILFNEIGILIHSCVIVLVKMLLLENQVNMFYLLFLLLDKIYVRDLSNGNS